uniref:Insertion element IS150 protein InsJ-like helix-turn-helix domain-containing protein n=2 Tax=Oreochromis TaxID=8139 RepID=A0A669EIK2_ORENI
MEKSTNDELTDFEKGKIVGARIGGMSVSETAELCNVSARTVMKVMSAYKNYGFTASAQKKKTRKPQKNTVANGKAARAKVVPESEVETQNPDEDMDTPEPKTQEDE